MPGDTRFFFDTYAIIEMIKGNPNYRKYLNKDLITSDMNLFELHLHLMREFGRELATTIIEECYEKVIEFDIIDIENTTQFKIENSNLRPSIPDSLGYNLAKRHGLSFLTGDKAFEGMENVEFVK